MVETAVGPVNAGHAKQVGFGDGEAGGSCVIAALKSVVPLSEIADRALPHAARPLW